MNTRIHPDPRRRGHYVLLSEIVIPRSVDDVFSFFADAFQLEAVTPPWLKFRVLTPRPIEIEEGTLIDYRLRLHGLPIRWRTRISAWEPGERFVDEQIRGPYRRWHHEHTFETHAAGTLVKDRVEYSVLGGRLVHSMFVRRDLIRIFDYRTRALRRVFEINPNDRGSENITPTPISRESQKPPC